MKIFLIFASCAFLIACGSTQTKENTAVTPADKTKLFLQFPEKNDIQFFGKVNNDTANTQSGAIVYPAYGIAGFIAGIATHAAIQSGIASAEEKRKAEMANQILEKYQSILASINAETIVDTGLSINIDNHKVDIYNIGQDTGDKNIFLANVKPAFYLTQDEKSLILVNELTFGETLTPPKKTHPIIVQYVSSPRSSHESDDYWQADEFANFKRVVRQSFLASIELGMTKHLGKVKSKGLSQETIRYLESGKKKVERGYVINMSCDRIIFKTLRGEIKSVPAHNIDAACEDISRTAISNNNM